MGFNLKNKYYLFWGIFLLLGIVGQLQAGKNYYLATNPQEKIYFGHISYLENDQQEGLPLIFREGKLKSERGVLNFPLASGDTILTTSQGKCEIQFDTGTIVRLDVNSRLRLETIMAPSLSSRKRLTNLVLSQGQLYLMYKRYARSEIFQIITSRAAIKFDHNSVAYIWLDQQGNTGIEVVRGKVGVLYGAKEDNLKKEKLSSGMRVLVLADRLIRAQSLPLLAEFKLWNEEINHSFVELHEGQTPLPLPLQRLPEAVYYFAQKYGQLYGEWVWHPYLGYVWRPFANSYYPWGRWQPYYYGHWREINGELFWVPDEPWGWVPYHLGLWTWDEKLGWVWIPGSAFAPAWVTWDFFFGYYLWRPWLFCDWMLWDGYGNSSWYYDVVYPYYYDRNLVLLKKPGQQKSVLRKVRRDQLKKKTTPPFKMSREWRGFYKNYVKKLKQQDQRVLASLRKVIDNSLCLKSPQLNRLDLNRQVVRLAELSPLLASQQKGLEEFSQPPSCQEVKTQVVVDFMTAELRETLDVFTFKPLPKMEQGGKSRVSLPFSRIFPARELYPVIGNQVEVTSRGVLHRKASFSRRQWLDWNPDIKVARRLGVNIKYSAVNNEVRCPELHLTSRKYASSVDNHYFGGRLTSSGPVYTSTNTSTYLGLSSRTTSTARVAPRTNGVSQARGGARTGNKK